MDYSPWSKREIWPFLRVAVSSKPERPHPPKLVCIHCDINVILAWIFWTNSNQLNFLMTMDYSPCPEREIWPFLKVATSPKPRRPRPPKLVCMHFTSIPTCMNFLSQFRLIEFFDDLSKTEETTPPKIDVHALWHQSLFAWIFWADSDRLNFLMTMDYSPCPEREIWPFLKVAISPKPERPHPPKLVCIPCDINVIPAWIFWANSDRLNFLTTMDYSPCPKREIWLFLKGSNISKSGETTPTKIGVYTLDINPILAWIFLNQFRSIKFFDDHGL